MLHVEDDADLANVLRSMLAGVAEVDWAPSLKQALSGAFVKSRTDIDSLVSVIRGNIKTRGMDHVK